MIQWIITALILAAALIYAVIRVFRYFRGKGSGQSDCESFGGDCAKCIQARGNTADCDPGSTSGNKL